MSSIYASRISLFSVGFRVRFSPASSSGSSWIVGFDPIAVLANILAHRSGPGFPWCRLRSCFSPVICQYASYVPRHSPSFPSPLRPSRHVSVLPVTSPSPSSLYFTYRSLSSFIVSPSFVLRLFFRYGSIPPLLCSEHHSSDLWLRYHTLTSSHSCGWTISLLSSWSYDFIS